MPESRPDPSSPAPFGTEPRRPAWPLILAIVVFVAFCAFLLWMALAYPAR